MSTFPRILVIHNPTSGGNRGPRFGRVLAALSEREAEVDVRTTTRAGHAEEIARAEYARSWDAIVVAGGDGTIAEVANGLGPDAPPLGVIPLGTANVLAAEIGLSYWSGAIARTILKGERRKIHAGRANGRRFLLMAGAGLDAEVVAHLDPALKRRLGKLAYVIETWRQMRRYEYPLLDVTADNQTFHAVTAVACKGRRYGGPHLFAPGADLARPEFELVLFEKGGAARVSLYGAALVTGLLRFLPGVTRVTARDIGISGRDGAPLQGDGDLAGHLPVAIAIDPEPLEVLYPPRR